MLAAHHPFGLLDDTLLESWNARLAFRDVVSHTMVIPEHSVALIVNFYGGAPAEVSVKVALASGPGRFAAPAKAGLTPHPAGK